MGQFLRVYWIIYYLSYLIAVALLLWLYWSNLLAADGNARIFLLAAVFGTAVGTALVLAMLTEIGGRIVLLIPAEVKRLINKGRREQRNRNREAYKRFGVEVDGVVMLPDTPEVQAFLNGETSDGRSNEAR